MGRSSRRRGEGEFGEESEMSHFLLLDCSSTDLSLKSFTPRITTNLSQSISAAGGDLFGWKECVQHSLAK